MRLAQLPSQTQQASNLYYHRSSSTIPSHWAQSTMPPLPPSSRCARNLLRLRPSSIHPRAPTACLAATSQQRRHKADAVERASGQYDTTPAFDSPFKTKDDNPTTKIPNFSRYMSKRGSTSNKTFQYFMVGGMGLLAAAGAKATVQGELLSDSIKIKCQKSRGLNLDGPLLHTQSVMANNVYNFSSPFPGRDQLKSQTFL